MDCCVIGTGYVGLVTGACFAELGHSVVCADSDAEKIRLLSGGSVPIYEADLEGIVNRNLETENLKFTTDIQSAVSLSEFVFITVGTPSDPDGKADLTQVDNVARDIATAIHGYKVIVNKSTVPVGSTRRVQRTYRGEHGGVPRVRCGFKSRVPAGGHRRVRLHESLPDSHW